MKHLRLWIVVALLLAYWGARTWALTAFPPFIDESIHIEFGRVVLSSGPLARVEEGRQFVLWLYILFGAQSSAPLWTVRIATLFTTLVGAAALYGAARLLTNRWGAIFTLLLLLTSPYHHFFERLALADPISSSAVMLAIYFAARLTKRVEFRYAVLCGVALFLACGAKLSALPYLIIPLFALSALRPSRAGVRWAIIALIVGVGLNVTFWGIAIWRGYDPFFHLHSSSSVLTLDSALMNSAFSIETLVGYFGAPAAVLMLISVGALVLRRRFFLPLCLALPLVVLWLSPREEARYFFAPLTLLILCLGVALGALIDQRREWRLPLLIVVIIWGLVLWLPFAITEATAPGQLVLPEYDHVQYQTSEGSGFGLAAVLDVLNEVQPRQVIGILANCFSLHDLAPFSVECPALNPNGDNVPALAALLESSKGDSAYAVLEDNPYVPATAPGRLIAVVDVGRPRLSIYKLTP